MKGIYKTKNDDNLFKSLRVKTGLKQVEVAKKLNLNTSTISKWESGKTLPDQSILPAVAQLYNTSTDFLLGNELPTNVYNEDIISFPVIGSIRAGYGGTAIEDFTEEIQEVPTSIIKGHKQSDFMVLRVEGNSMYPQFFDGDRVLVRKCPSVDSGSIAVVLYNGDEATVKQVVYKTGEDWVDLIPRNPDYPPMRIKGSDLEQCKILGQVVYLFRKI